MSTHSGINHIEFWVTNLARSSAFYTPVLGAIGWRKLTDSEFSSGSTVLFLVEKIVPKADSVGPPIAQPPGVPGFENDRAGRAPAAMSFAATGDLPRTGALHGQHNGRNPRCVPAPNAVPAPSRCPAV